MPVKFSISKFLAILGSRWDFLVRKTHFKTMQEVNEIIVNMLDTFQTFSGIAKC